MKKEEPKEKKYKFLAQCDYIIDMNKNDRNEGVFFISEFDGNKYFSFFSKYKYWEYQNNIYFHDLLRIPLSMIQKAEQEKTHVLTNKITHFEIQESDTKPEITFESENIRFKYCANDIQNFFLFLRFIVINGIAIPITDNSNKLLLHFIEQPKFQICPITNCHETKFGTNVKELWKNLQETHLNMVTDMCHNKSILLNPPYPIGFVVNSEINKLLQDFSFQKDNSVKPKKVTLDEINGLETISSELRNRLYASGVETEALKQIIPITFGWNKDTEQSFISQYKYLVEKVKIIMETNQLRSNTRLEKHFKVIANDVARTESTLFKSTDASAREILYELLRSYSVYNPYIGYVQGMNDICVPFIELFISNWENGKSIINEDEQICPKIFWCFHQMLISIKFDEFLHSVVSSCERFSTYLRRIFDQLIPIVNEWLDLDSQLSNVFWMFSSFIMIFKRDFPNDIWKIWTKIIYSNEPKEWIVYLSAAIFFKVYSKISYNTLDLANVITQQYKNAVKDLDIDELGEIALWIYGKVNRQEVFKDV